MPSDQGGMVEAKSQPSILNKDSSLGFPIAGCGVSSNSYNNNNNNNSKATREFHSTGRTNDRISVGSSSSSSSSITRNDPDLSGDKGVTIEKYSQSIGSRTNLVANLGKTQASLFTVRFLF